MQALANRFMGLFALALSLPETYFEPYVDHAACGLRGICYPARSDTAGTGPACAPARTPTTAPLTLLRQDTVGGLEVTTRTGEWVGVESIPGRIRRQHRAT